MRIIKQDLRIRIYNRSGNWYIDWYKNNTHHREDGQSMIWSDRGQYYHLDSKYYLEHEYWKKINENY